MPYVKRKANKNHKCYICGKVIKKKTIYFVEEDSYLWHRVAICSKCINRRINRKRSEYLKGLKTRIACYNQILKDSIANTKFFKEKLKNFKTNPKMKTFFV